MKIDHIAFWVRDLEKMKFFYEKYFHGKSNLKYQNTAKKFQSYFISFNNGCRLELMYNPDMVLSGQQFDHQQLGIVHLAFSVGNKEQVDSLTNRLRQDGFIVVGEPRTTGDGFYESIILDPENNIIEITT